MHRALHIHAVQQSVNNAVITIRLQIRSEMVAAGVALVDEHGAGHAQELLPLFEGYLQVIIAMY